MKSRENAFSLLELLVVVAVILVLASLAVPAFNSIGRASSLTAGTQAMVGALEQARQLAISRNRPVEVRLYKMAEYGQPGTASPVIYRALQLFVIDSGPNGTIVTNSISRMTKLSSPVIISTNTETSSLMDLQENPAPPGMKISEAGENYRYRSFRFRPEGGTDLNVSSNWFLTIHGQNDKIEGDGMPANFVTIQVDPQTGRTRVFRP